MCGISGILTPNGTVSEESLAPLTAINNALRHRGPDDGDFWFSKDRKVGLGHRRLSIVDLSQAGRQPMHSHSGRYVTVFNGEIYNFLDLRRELEKLGHAFIGSSDTEVLLASVEQWGLENAVTKFNGMFAVALWDLKERRLHLFRDRLGVKPLYYQWHEGRLSFSSELTPEFAALGPKEIDIQSLALYFRYYCIPGERSIYKSIRKLLPGVIATTGLEDVARARFQSLTSYWDTEKRINAILQQRRDSPVPSETDSLKSLDAALRKSVTQRMIADVPLGAFLSGGIDSSLIVSYMALASPRPVKTFTIGFHDERFNEAKAAQAIARHLGTEHTEFYLTEKEALDVIPSLPGMYGEPFADSSQIPTYLVSKLTRQQVTVALSGDGGDELFAGYVHHQTIARMRTLEPLLNPNILVMVSKLLSAGAPLAALKGVLGNRHWGRMTRILRLLAGSQESRMPSSFDGHVSRSENLVRGASPGSSLRLFSRVAGNPVESAMCDDLMHFLPDDILTKVDRASMRASLEVRAPFVDDFELFETAWRIPFAYKQRNGLGGKLILKKLLAQHVPPELFDRPKQGFAVPVVRWLNGPLKEWVEECTAPPRIRAEGHLNSELIQEIRAHTARGSHGHATTLWAICNFQTWLRQVHTPVS